MRVPHPHRRPSPVATIEPYETQSGKRYRVRYRKPDGKQTDMRGFRRKLDAEKFAGTVEHQKMSGEYVAPSLGRVTVGELAPKLLLRKEVDVASSNYRTLDSAWRTHVQSRWGTTTVADIELDAVETWVADMGRTITDPQEPEKVIRKASGATTIVRAYGILAGILDTAVKSKRLGRAHNHLAAAQRTPSELSGRFRLDPAIESCSRRREPAEADGQTARLPNARRRGAAGL